MCPWNSRTGLIAATLTLAVSTLVSAGTSTLQNPPVAFATPGAKTVTLEACNRFGCTSFQQTVIVLDPQPKIVSAAPASASAEVGQLVRLDASATGRPALNYSWTVFASGDPNPVASASGAPAYWATGNVAPGAYNVTLHLSNSDGFDDWPTPMPVTLVANTATDFYTIAPCRLVDTRILGGALASGESRLLPSSFTTCGIPVAARALAANITVASPTATGSVKLFPGNYPVPLESVVNFTVGITRANSQVLPVSTDGAASLQAAAELPAGASVHLIVDVSGYFAPTTP